MKTAKRFFGWLFSVPIKLWSVKTIPAVVFTIKFLQDTRETPDIAMMTYTFLAWAFVIGMRYAEKVSGFLKPFDTTK